MSSVADPGIGATKQPLPVGSMVWGKLPGYDMWPGLVISYDKRKEKPQATEEEEDGNEEEEEHNRETEEDVEVWIKWFGDNQLSQVCLQTLVLVV